MNNFGRNIKITVGRANFSNEDLEIRFEAPFDDDPIPNESKVEIFNLSNNTIAQLKKGDTATIQAGYQNDIGVIASGKIRKVLTKNEGVNKITSIFIVEGEDFSRIKVTEKTADKGKKTKITFKAGTLGSTIINRLISLLGIKLGAPIKLKTDKVYKKGYVVSQLILNNLEEVIRDCGSVMYHRRGKLIIRPLNEGTDERFILEEDTGLIGSPQPFEQDDQKGYTVKCLLQHRIVTASIITIKSKTANGKYRAKKGKHICDANDFYSEFDVI